MKLEDVLDMRIDDAMRFGASLGGWIRSGDPLVSLAAQDAFKEVRKTLVKAMMNTIEQKKAEKTREEIIRNILISHPDQEQQLAAIMAFVARETAATEKRLESHRNQQA